MINHSFFSFLLKAILGVFFGLGLLFLNACKDKDHPADKNKPQRQEPETKTSQGQKNPEQTLEAEIQQAQAHEQAKFKSLGECLKAKKEKAGVSKPTVEMIQQCKNKGD